jgi:hypothetical protein
MSPPMISKAAARYTGAGGKEHCSLCRHFSPRRGGRCARVLGDISPMGWCKLFSREMRGMVADASSFNGGGGGPSLSLDFMTPGTLSPLITFTRASTATYFDSAGVMQTAAVNAPRWDYDPVTLALRGLLLEDQRANLAFPSVVNNTTWTVGAGTLTLNAAVAPDGTNTASLFIDNATVSPHGMTTVSTVSYANATAYTVSIYAKQASARGLQIYTSGAPFGAPFANFDLQAGTVGTTSGATATIQSVGNGWYRCIMTATTIAATSGVTFVTGLTNNLNNAPRSLSYAGTGTGVFMWGAQTEAGGFATSYIPTTAAAVTRAMDNASMPTGAWFNPAASSLLAEYMVTTSLGIAPTGCDACGLSDGTAANKMVLRGQNSAQATGLFFSTIAGASTLSVARGPYTGGVPVKLAAMWNGVAPRGALNGGAVVGYSSALPAGINVLAIGNQVPGGTAPLSGHIRRVSYWSKALTDVELQALTL